MASPRFKDQPLPPAIDVKGPAEAWMTVVPILLQAPGKSIFHVVVRMTDPLTVYEPFTSAYNKFLKKYKLPSADGVAAAIFPRSFYRFQCKSDRHALYARYPEFRRRVARLFKKKPSFSYFLRLTQWQPLGVTKPVNQLETFISRMATHKAKRAAWYFYPTIDPTRDLGKIMSGPCLTAIDLKFEIEHNTLNMFAFYRDHEFAQKAYGNYLGLTHLLEFLCEQTETAIGAVTCVSLRARIEAFSNDLENLIVDL